LGGSVKVDLKCEIDRFGLSVRGAFMVDVIELLSVKEIIMSRMDVLTPA